MQKVIKWLTERGYACNYTGYESYIHNNCIFNIDVYHISNGMYIRAKEETSKKRYVLYADEEAFKNNKPFTIKHCNAQRTRINYRRGKRFENPYISNGSETMLETSQEKFILMLDEENLFPPQSKKKSAIPAVKIK